MALLPSFHRHVRSKDLLMALRNLAVTLRAGIPIVQSLRLLENDAPPGRRGYLTQLRESVEKGTTLAVAMEYSSWMYPPVVINLVRAGELSGTLSRNIEEVVQYLTKNMELWRKLRAAMTYPLFVFIAVVGLGLSVATFVLPQLIPLFDSLDVELPFMTRVILAGAHFFSDYGLIFTPLFVLACVGCVFLLRMRSVRPIFHRTLLMIPLVRTIQRNSAIAHITRTLATLLRNGIPIDQAIVPAAQATGNAIFQSALIATLPLIQEGNTLAQSLTRGTHIFPPMTVTLIDIGESTGTLADTLAYLANYYEEEVDYAVKNLTTALEPLLLIVVGVIVAAFILAIITPIYDITSKVG